MTRRRNKQSRNGWVYILAMLFCAWVISKITIYGFLLLAGFGACLYYWSKREVKLPTVKSASQSTQASNTVAHANSAITKKFVELSPVVEEPIEEKVISSASSMYARIAVKDESERSTTTTVDKSTKAVELPVKSQERVRKTNIMPPSSDEELGIFTIKDAQPSPPVFTIPAPPQTIIESIIPATQVPIGVKWFGKSESVTIGSFTITDGLLLVGKEGSSIDGENYDTAGLINPTLPIAPKGNYTTRAFGYWPRYSQLIPEARTAYLQWLTSGKCDPKADIGYVFIYFYGLEKRFFDILPTQVPSTFDVTELRNECERLHRLYGPLNKSFNSYVVHFLQFMLLTSSEQLLEIRNDASLIESADGSSLFLRMLAGQRIKEGKALDFEIIKLLIAKDPIFKTGDVLKKMPDIFWRIFRIEFESAYPEGFYVDNNGSQLQAAYHPASPPWSSQRTMTVTIRDVPDIFSLAKPQHEIQKIINFTLNLLESHKKHFRVASHRSNEQSLFALPSKYWPSHFVERIGIIAERLKNFTFILKGSDITADMDLKTNISLQALSGVAKELEERYHIGIIPHPDGFLVAPSSSDIYVLYRIEQDDGSFVVDEQYPSRFQSALACIELGSIVAHADKDFSAEEFSFIYKQIESWAYLKPSDRSFLKGKTRYLHEKPINLTSLKRRVQKLELNDIQTICTFISKLAHADGQVSSAEIKFLEKIYALLGVAPSQVSIDIKANATTAPQLVEEPHHSTSNEPQSKHTGVPDANANGTAPKKPSFVLDKERIASLHQENQQVSVLLGAIFSDDEDTAAADARPVTPANPSSNSTIVPIAVESSNLLGLDVPHTQFLRSLLQRPLWSRAEIEQFASQCGLMTDGALDCINEAVFEQFDMPLIEGNDPLVINLDLLESDPQ